MNPIAPHRVFVSVAVEIEETLTEGRASGRSAWHKDGLIILSGVDFADALEQAKHILDTLGIKYDDKAKP